MVAVVVLVVGAAVGYGEYLNHKVHRIAIKGLAPAASSGTDAGTENILLVGSTTRCGLAKQTPAYGLCTQGVTGVNSDVIMILHLDQATKTVSILSIPRDLFVPNARSTGAYKVDAALAQGPSQLVATVQEDFGIPVQHYVELNFDTFAAVVTAFGGLTMEFPDRVFDRDSGLRVFTTGCHHLTGVQALQVVRARHLQYWVTGDTPGTPSTWPQEAQSDLARIERDHEFLRVLADKVKQRGLDDPSTDLSILNAVLPDLTVDSSFSLSDMVGLVADFHTVNPDTAPQYTLPVLVSEFGTYVYEGADFGDIEFPTQPIDHGVVDEFLGETAATDTMSGKPLPAPGSVTVSVLNGTGATGQATQTASALGDLGFSMVGTGDTTVVAQQSETLVTYSSLSPAVEADAQLVADSLSGAVILDYGATTDGADVTVTTGTDFTVDPSVPTPTHTGAPTTSTTPKSSTKAKSVATTTTSVASTPSATPATTTPAAGSTTTSTTPDFAPPSAATPGLTTYDPRACAPGQKGNTGNW